MTNSPRSIVLLLLLAFIWGSSFWLIELGLTELTATQVGLLRIITAALCLLPFSLHELFKRNLPWLWLGLIGLIGNLIPALLFAVAQQVLHSALAGMLNTLQPLFAVLVSVMAFKRQIPQRQIHGLLIAFAGCILLLGFTEDTLSLNEHISFSLLIVLATLCYGVSTNLIKEFCDNVAPLHIAAISLNMLLIPCLILLFWFGMPSWESIDTATFSALTSVFMLGSVGTALALVIFNYLIKQEGIIFASTVTYLIPIVATAWGVLAKEPIHPFHLAGITTILLGVWIVNYQKAPVRS